MELTRRDALAALAAGGIAVGGGAAALALEGESAGLGDHERETLVAVARVVYPSELEGVESFVRTYLEGRAAEDPDYVEGVGEAVRTLDESGRDWFDGSFLDLDPETRDRLLRELGVDEADPDPTGFPGSRVRYYLVNELLYALYTSPTGGRLAGIENPQGHPGGVTSYRRGPDR
jgi:hypothetical protein